MTGNSLPDLTSLITNEGKDGDYVKAFTTLASRLNTHGNFELLVPMRNKVKHYWRNNATDFSWNQGYDLPLPTSSFPSNDTVPSARAEIAREDEAISEIESIETRYDIPINRSNRKTNFNSEYAWQRKF